MNLKRTGRVLGLCAMALVVLALVGWLVLGKVGDDRRTAGLERLEAVVGSLDLASLAPPEIPFEENGILELEAGAAAWLYKGDPRVSGNLASRPLREWDAKEIQVARELVEFNAPALELLRRGGQRPQAGFELDYLQGARVELPDFGKILKAARLLVLDGRLALLAGEDDRLISNLAALENLAAAHRRENIAILQLIGASIDRIEASLVHDLLSRSDSEDLLRRTLATLGEDDRNDGLLSAYRGESVIMATGLHELEREQDPLIPTVWRLQAGALFRAMAELRAVLDLPLPEMIEATAEIRHDHPSRLAEQFLTNFPSMALQVRAAEAARRLARVALALRIDALRSGAYPPRPDAYPAASEPIRLTAEVLSYAIIPTAQ